mmetsp:Transcript_9195/g.12702  ORF Transcript_9195/g.12702 Transcript_9195/m.12702 type:complete len:314 (+) Transcript_9195:213-1154(+)
MSNLLDGQDSFVLKPPHQWTADTLEALEMYFVDISHTEMFPIKPLSVKASKVLEELKNVDREFFFSFEKRFLSAQISPLLDSGINSKRPHSEISSDHCDSKSSGETAENNNYDDLKNPLCKALFVMGKYSHLDSLVHSFVFQLLCLLGFNDDWLYISPQRPMQLRSKNRGIIATPDFAIMDLVSLCRVIVFVDKRADERETIDTEAELVAEALAAQQFNIVRQKDPSLTSSIDSDDKAIFGVRVRGYCFTFYRIPLSHSVFRSIHKEIIATEVTIVHRCSRHLGFDFRVPEDRKIIIATLDALLFKIKQLGRE